MDMTRVFGAVIQRKSHIHRGAGTLQGRRPLSFVFCLLIVCCQFAPPLLRTCCFCLQLLAFCGLINRACRGICCIMWHFQVICHARSPLSRASCRNICSCTPNVSTADFKFACSQSLRNISAPYNTPYILFKANHVLRDT